VKIKILRMVRRRRSVLRSGTERAGGSSRGGETGQAFGMVVQEITPEIAKHLGLSTKKG